MLNETSPENNMLGSGYHNNNDAHQYDRRGRSCALFSRPNHHASGGAPPGRALLKRIHACIEGVKACVVAGHRVECDKPPRAFLRQTKALYCRFLLIFSRPELTLLAYAGTAPVANSIVWD
ncbi:MAG TPA: hypothetical protein VMX13_11850 [Sedimentisphaerales bacterium]|nr:hypothetical protein [Sedimentisphaerales bacterium]